MVKLICIMYTVRQAALSQQSAQMGWAAPVALHHYGKKNRIDQDLPVQIKVAIFQQLSFSPLFCI